MLFNQKHVYFLLVLLIIGNASSYGATVIGHYNSAKGETYLRVATDPLLYTGIKTKDTTSGHIGVIAQELFPELMKKGNDRYLSVSYMEMVPLLIEEIKELKLKNEALISKMRISKEYRGSEWET